VESKSLSKEQVSTAADGEEESKTEKPEKRPQTSRQRGMKKFKKMEMEEAPVDETDMSIHQKRKAEAKQLKQEQEMLAKKKALEQQRILAQKKKEEKERKEREEHAKKLE
jgi:hypothetical protein